MKRNILFYICLLLIVNLTGCNLPKTIRDPEITTFNQALKTNFQDIVKVTVYISRPNINWNINVKDSSHEDEIMQYIVKFLKDSNIYENKLKEEYVGIYYINKIDISFINGKDTKTYEGYYYQRGATIYPDDKNNKIDNFSTWYISKNRIDDGTKWVYEVKPS